MEQLPKWMCGLRKAAICMGLFMAITPMLARGQAACTLQAGQPESACTGCTPITGNTNINNGDVACFSGTSLIVGAINISNGGTLLVCSGTLTVGSLAFNGGNIIVNTGATLNIGINPVMTVALGFEGITNYGSITVSNSFTLNGNQYLVNYGSFTYLTADFNLNGTNTLLQNNEDGVMNLKSVNVGGNARIINGGELNVSENLRINANGAMCLLKCAITNTVNLFNQQTNSVVVGPNPARPCISYSGNAEMNAPLSGSSRLTVCKATGATVSGGASIPFGFAQVNENCASCQPTLDACNILLPLTFQSFEVQKMNSLLQASWSMATDVSIASCSLEGSSDGVTYSSLKTWNSNQTAYNVSVPINGFCLFRIKAITSSGSVYYSAVKAIDCADLKQSFFAWAQPAASNKLIQMRFLQQVPGLATIFIADAQGRNVHSLQITVPKGVYSQSLDLQALGKNLPHGMYFVTVQFRDGQHYSQKLVW